MGDSGGRGPIYVMEDGSSNDQAAVLSGKLVVAAAMFFLLTVIFVVLLYLYTRWRWGRRSTSAAAEAYRSSFDIEGTEVITRLHGLDSDVIKSLPIVVFETKDFKDGIECAVCLSELFDGEKARILPKCNHGFHLECINMWFYSHSTCPLCRNPVRGHLEIIGSDVPTDGPSSSSENSSLPINVLFWGTGTGLVRETHSSSTPPPPPCTTTDGMLVIDIPRSVISEASSTASPPLSPSSSKTPTPTSTRLKSLKSLLVTTPK